jgi:hypothetical protein
MKLAEIVSEEVQEWVRKKRIPGKIYKELAKENEPLPSKLYIDPKVGKGWAQMHFRGIEPEQYKQVKSGKLPLWKALEGQSVHIDLRIDFPGMEKLVQYVITESDIQSMFKMLKGEKRETQGGVMNVQHSMVVSKPSGEPPESYGKLFSKPQPESSNPKDYSPSINEEGAKMADELILHDGSYWIKPGGIGATKNTYAYMALIWQGTVKTGTERHDLHELFMSKEKAKDDFFDGKFVIKCLKGPEKARWEIWEAITKPIPMCSITHSDIGYHYLIPASKVKGFGREYYRKRSQELFMGKLKR